MRMNAWKSAHIPNSSCPSCSLTTVWASQTQRTRRWESECVCVCVVVRVCQVSTCLYLQACSSATGLRFWWPSTAEVRRCALNTSTCFWSGRASEQRHQHVEHQHHTSLPVRFRDTDKSQSGSMRPRWLHKWMKVFIFVLIRTRWRQLFSGGVCACEASDRSPSHWSKWAAFDTATTVNQL